MEMREAHLSYDLSMIMSIMKLGNESERQAALILALTNWGSNTKGLYNPSHHSPPPTDMLLLGCFCGIRGKLEVSWEGNFSRKGSLRPTLQELSCSLSEAPK